MPVCHDQFRHLRATHLHKQAASQTWLEASQTWVEASQTWVEAAAAGKFLQQMVLALQQEAGVSTSFQSESLT